MKFNEEFEKVAEKLFGISTEMRTMLPPQRILKFLLLLELPAQQNVLRYFQRSLDLKHLKRQLYRRGRRRQLQP